MKGPTLIDRIDDAVNPIVIKELRESVANRAIASALILFLFLQLAVVLVYLLRGAGVTPGEIDYRAGRDVFVVVQGILLGVTMLVVPLYSGVRLAAERSDVNVDLLFISALRPRAIVLGKFLASAVLCLLMFSACAPFMTFAYLLRGLDIPTILIVLAGDFLVVLLASQLTLLLAAVPGNRGVKVMLGLLGLSWLIGLFTSTQSVVAAAISERGLFAVNDRDFFLGLGSTAAGAIALTGMLFLWTVALISPPSANRSLTLRIYLVLAWLASAGAAIAWSFRVENHAPVIMWLFLWFELFGFHFLVAISERDTWGARVRRTIPRSLALRPFAFLFYSGAAGGVTLFVVLIALSVAALSFWLGNVHYAYVEELRSNNLVRACLAAGLYIYCYCMTAVVIRSYLLWQFVKPILTWLIAMLLLAFGCIGPGLIALALSTKEIRQYRPGVWWEYGNPFQSLWMIGQSGAGYEDFAIWCMFFLGSWAAVVTVACLPWYVNQIGRFRPLARVQAELIPEAAA